MEMLPQSLPAAAYPAGPMVNQLPSPLKPQPATPDSGMDELMVGSEPPYECKICGKGFAIPARLQRHHRVHTGEKPFKCEFCEKTFSVKENLNVHRRIHTKERPYKCSICERAFEHSGKLHRHMRTHTGERPHKCEVCGKTFVQSGQLVIHMRAHTGEKPYSCEYCQKGFTCSKQLKVHIRTHTGEKPYECDVCGKTFGYNHVLKMHKMSHLGEKLYKCTLCEEFFSSRKALDRHIRDHGQDAAPLHRTPKTTGPLASPAMPPSTSPSGSSSPASVTYDEYPDHRKSFREFRGSESNGVEAYPGYDKYGSGSPGYVSDDSGRGTSPVSDTLSPPRSPVSLGSIMNTQPLPNHPESLPHDNLMFLRQFYPSLAMPMPEGGYGAQPVGHKYSYPYDLMLSIQNKKQLLSQRFAEHEALRLQQQHQQLQEHLLREEARRRREVSFIATVERVLEALVGKERLANLGYPATSIDEILIKTISLMGSQPCKEPSLNDMDRIKVNLRLLLEYSVPDQTLWVKFGWRGKPIEDIVNEFLQYC